MKQDKQINKGNYKPFWWAQLAASFLHISAARMGAFVRPSHVLGILASLLQRLQSRWPITNVHQKDSQHLLPNQNGWERAPALCGAATGCVS